MKSPGFEDGAKSDLVNALAVVPGCGCGLHHSLRLMSPAFGLTPHRSSRTDG